MIYPRNASHIVAKFQGKYRISSARLRGCDYSVNGAYFITICTKNREPFFGEIVNRNMVLSDMGKIVVEEWIKTSDIRKNVELGEWVVMPDHFHAIVIIRNCAQTHCVETHCNASLPNKFGPQSRNIPSIIRGFKGSVVRRIRATGFLGFAWQPRFHDWIIRDEGGFQRVSEYIFANPQNWKRGRFS